MAKGEATKRGAGKPAKRPKPALGFSEEERAAMKDRLEELKAAGQGEGEGAVLAKIASMPEPDRSMGRRIHDIVRASAPALVPRLWYGMPAYARGGKVVCFFQNARKFKARYSLLGFSDKASLDDGALWPTAFALKELTVEGEARISALVKKAAETPLP